MLIATANHSKKNFGFSGVNKSFSSVGFNVIEPFACQFLPSAPIVPDWYCCHSKHLPVHLSIGQSVHPEWSGFYTKDRPLVKSNLICPSDKLRWQPGCPILNINIQGNYCISQGNGSSDNLPENLV